MAGYIVVEGATLSCPAGSEPVTLVVTSNTIEKISGELVATVADAVSMSNVPSFGTCTILTAQANGVTCPCVPSIAGLWTPGSTTHKIGGVAVLTQSATLACAIGGSISIDDPAQMVATAD